MPEFLWTGINQAGEKITGKINADHKINAKHSIENNEITILSLKKNSFAFLFQSNKKFSPKHRLDFTQQLQLLLQSHIPLVDALLLIATTSTHPIIQSVSRSLINKITTGMNLAAALSDFPYYFDNTYCHIISAGEQSAQLEMVLTQLIADQENRLQLKNKIAKTLFYPISVLCIALIIAGGLLIFVIPQFKAIYDNFGAPLPTATQCLISMSHYLSQQGLYNLFIITPLFIFFRKMVKKNISFGNFMQKLWFNVPILKTVIITRQIAQWSQLLAMTLSAGIPLIDALHIANHAVSQSILETQLQHVRNAVIGGKSLHAALDLCHHFPARAKTMIAIGENADSLAFMMKKIAALYQQNLNDTLDRLSKLLEPVIMIIVASLVSGLIIAMYLPIFKMGNVV